MKHCRTCHEPIKDEKKGCRNGCDQFTAVPCGSVYANAHGFTKGSDGRVVEYGGIVGNLRRMPTSRDE